MAGTVQHQGRIYSIRHMGGDMHAVVEMAEDKMPQEHAPMPERMRSNDPNVRDDPLIATGRREHHAAGDRRACARRKRLQGGKGKKKQQTAMATKDKAGAKAKGAQAGRTTSSST